MSGVAQFPAAYHVSVIRQYLEAQEKKLNLERGQYRESALSNIKRAKESLSALAGMVKDVAT